MGHQIIRQPDGTDADVAAYVSLYGPPGMGPGWSLAGYTADGEPVWRMNYRAGHGGEDLVREADSSRRRAAVTIQRYRRKPKQEDREDQFAARYEPGAPLDDLLIVARMADRAAELTEVMFPSYGPVLFVRYTRYDDDRPPKTEYETVEAGHYLAYSPGNDFLYDTDEAGWRQFYDLVTGDG